MLLVVNRSNLNGTVKIPGSKSHTIRAVAIAALADGKSIIRSPLVSNDTLSAVHCYRMLGAQIDTSNPQTWLVNGTGCRLAIPDEPIDVGNSGTTLRIATGSASLVPAGSRIILTGDEQTRSRPMAQLIHALNQLGASVRSVKGNGKAPIEVNGGLQGGSARLESPTSQFLTSLLLCAPLAPMASDIEVTLLNEPGYVEMTIDWLRLQGVQFQADGLRYFHVKGGQRYKPFDRAIPADFSSAAFFLCGAALFGGKVTLTGLDINDSQPDRMVIEYLKAMGARIETSGQQITITGSQLRGIDIDMNNTPDALPAMAVTGALASGTTRLLNVPQARSKETDRIAVMAKELSKLGVRVEELPDGLVVHNSTIRPTRVSGHSDHRVVMALALAGLATDGPLVIGTAEAMNVTFPQFVELMQTLGARMELQAEC
ncbi:MAG: 3-phosphoshikimate 1-carboxyvinyltransferase [Sedimentisphaerales bacterium]|nr:3-phosphoshikimate 1-carboxyvinyltransferase [Sedimentisphaerales bacterium]